MRVLVTTERRQPLVRLLEAGGAAVVHVPLLETVPVQTAPPSHMPRVALVTSAAAVRHAPQLGALLAHAQVVAVGTKSAQALQNLGIAPVAVGTAGGAEAVDLLSAVAPSAPILHVGAETLSRPLARALGALDRPVQRWVVYRSQVPAAAAAQLACETADAVALASGSAARAFATHWKGPVPAVVALGPTTAREATEAGLPVRAQASRPTLEALAAAVLALSP